MPPSFLTRTPRGGCQEGSEVVDLIDSNPSALWKFLEIELKCKSATKSNSLRVVVPFLKHVGNAKDPSFAFAGKEGCQIPGGLYECRFIEGYGPHLTTEDFPPFDGGSLSSWSQHFALNAYEVKCL